MIFLLIALAASCLLFVYPFLLYPLYVRLTTERRASAAPEAVPADREWPEITLLICALNEQKVIQQKLENCVELQYPREKLKVIIVSDGSTDATAEVVRTFTAAHEFIELRDYPNRCGKIARINSTVPTLTSAIVALSDANVMYHPNALQQLVVCFDDPTVGAASGKVILQDTTQALDTATDTYYSVEWDIQQKNSDLYSLAGADGAMYAFRRHLYQPCPNDTLIEDFVIPMNIVRQGFRVVFQPRAIGWEQGVASVHEEYRRRVRIAAGAAQALLRGDGWPHNAPARFWFIFVSHKLLRWVSPITGGLVILLALLAVGYWWGQAILALLLLLVLLTALKWWTGSEHPILASSFYFLFSQVAVAIGLIRGCLGRQTVLWAKANR